MSVKQTARELSDLLQTEPFDLDAYIAKVTENHNALLEELTSLGQGKTVTYRTVVSKIKELCQRNDALHHRVKNQVADAETLFPLMRGGFLVVSLLGLKGKTDTERTLMRAFLEAYQELPYKDEKAVLLAVETASGILRPPTTRDGIFKLAIEARRAADEGDNYKALKLYHEIGKILG